MTQELTAQKTAAIRAELAHNPDVALTAVVHSMLTSLFNPYGGINEGICLEVKVTSEKLATSIKDAATCKALATINDLKENYGHTIPATQTISGTGALSSRNRPASTFSPMRRHGRSMPCNPVTTNAKGSAPMPTGWRRLSPST